MKTTEIMQQMNEVVKNAQKAQELVLAQGKALFENYLKALFEETSALQNIVIRGYTPGFNDGDECTHSTYFLVHDSDFSDYGFNDDCEEDQDKKFNPDLSKSDAKKIMKDLEKFEDALEGIYGTNWQLDITRKDDGTVAISESEYDCGH